MIEYYKYQRQYIEKWFCKQNLDILKSIIMACALGLTIGATARTKEQICEKTQKKM